MRKYWSSVFQFKKKTNKNNSLPRDIAIELRWKPLRFSYSPWFCHPAAVSRDISQYFSWVNFTIFSRFFTALISRDFSLCYKIAQHGIHTKIVSLPHISRLALFYCSSQYWLHIYKTLVDFGLLKLCAVHRKGCAGIVLSVLV